MTQRHADVDHDLIDRLDEFYRTYYRDAIGDLAGRYPNDQTSLVVDYQDLFRFDPDVADDVLAQPEQMRDLLEEALRAFDLPVDVSLGQAHVRVTNLPPDITYYPGEFSPTDEAGHYRAIRGEVSMATDKYAKIVTAAFECQRCATNTMVPQADDFQEPHECRGCERQGPFQINFDRSEFVDAQQLRIQTPPEVAASATELDVFVEDDLADVASTGDRVTVTGIVHLEQQSKGKQFTGKFDPYLEGHNLELDESDHRDMDISADERERIEALAAGAEGDPLEIAAASFEPSIYGSDYDIIKQMLILAMVGGARTVHQSGSAERGEFHMLVVGDPGTGKSVLIDRAEKLGWRTVGVSGMGATVAGVTATAKQDDFGPGDWTLAAGAFPKANRGVVCIDELDDMPPEVRAAMLEPMSKQTIHVTKAGINSHLQTQAAVVAAANPIQGRFDPYEQNHDQLEFKNNFQQRFDLIYALIDRPNEQEDEAKAGHILDYRDMSKRRARDDIDEVDREDLDAPIEDDLLRKWIGLAKQQPPPVFANDQIKADLRERFTELRGIHGYGEDAPVPIAWRKLPGLVRIAEAAAKFEFSDVIEERHARIALEAVGRSLSDFGKDEDGKMDADIVETGHSTTQRDRMKLVQETMVDLAGEHDTGDGVPREVIVDELEDSVPADRVEQVLNKMQREGMISEPSTDHHRWLGWT